VFVTVVRQNDRLAACVHFADCHVQISAAKEETCSMLKDVYRHTMTPMEFARANYQLNRFRPNGITWELMLSSEFKVSGN